MSFIASSFFAGLCVCTASWRSQIAKLFSNDQLETPTAAVSIKEEPTPNEEQPAQRGTVNSLLGLSLIGGTNLQ
jgi:hypothetical protein